MSRRPTAETMGERHEPRRVLVAAQDVSHSVAPQEADTTESSLYARIQDVRRFG